MVLTTHSPYVLSNVNDLLKAGAISRCSKSALAAVERVVPKNSWLLPDTVKAYAIRDKETVGIIGDDGLIDGEYLDEVSGDISREFSALLEIEIAECK